MNPTLEVVEFEGETGRGGSSWEEMGELEGGGESGNILCVNTE